jgi:hypothetical protein
MNDEIAYFQLTVKYDIFLSKSSKLAMTECDDFRCERSKVVGMLLYVLLNLRVVVVYHNRSPY